MTARRGRLQLGVWLWISFQALSLSAFVPRDCCRTGHAGAESQHGGHQCDESAFCPMRDAGGVACAMHRQADTSPKSRDACAMRGLCDGPEAPGALLKAGVLPSSPDAFSDAGASAVVLLPSEPHALRPTPPEPPPPRA